MKIKTLMIISLTLFVTTNLIAQPSMDNQRYRIDYVNESHLLLNDSVMTVVRLNFEWPKRLSNLPATALQKYLCRMFFNGKHENLDEEKACYLKDLGEEIQQMPNDEGLKRKYVNLKLITLGWEKDKYISLMAERTCRTGNNESPDSAICELLTYDIMADKVLRTKDIIRCDELSNRRPKSYLIEQILLNLPQGEEGLIELKYYFFYYLTNNKTMPENTLNVIDGGALPDEVCLIPEGIVFSVPKKNESGLFGLSVVPKDKISQYLISSAKKTLKGKRKRRKPEPETKVITTNSSTSVDSMSVYDFISIMPEYNGDKKDMMDYIYRIIEYPSYEKTKGIQGKVMVSFIVERDGSLSSPSVISPVSPGLDREAVKAVMSMPKWKPGMENNVPCRVRMSIPVTFKLEL